MFQKSDFTQRLYDLLRKVNGTIEYATIALHIGVPIAECRSALGSARKALERDEKIVFATERGVGLRRLTDQEIVWSSNQVRAQIHRRAKAGLRRLSSVGSIAALPPADQATALINRTIFAAVEGQARHASTVQAAEPQPSLLDVAARLTTATERTSA